MNWELQDEKQQSKVDVIQLLSSQIISKAPTCRNIIFFDIALDRNAIFLRRCRGRDRKLLILFFPPQTRQKWSEKKKMSQILAKKSEKKLTPSGKEWSNENEFLFREMLNKHSPMIQLSLAGCAAANRNRNQQRGDDSGLSIVCICNSWVDNCTLSLTYCKTIFSPFYIHQSWPSPSCVVKLFVKQRKRKTKKWVLATN